MFFINDDGQWEYEATVVGGTSTKNNGDTTNDYGEAKTMWIYATTKDPQN